MADTPKLDLADIQGIVLRPYGELKHAAYWCLQVEEPGRARAWLRGLHAEITRASQVVGVERKVRAQTRLNLALSWPGLAALGLDGDALATFPDELRQGMDDPERARILGDEGASAPQHWHFGVGTPTVDVLLLLYAGDEEALRRLEKREKERLSGVSLLHGESSRMRDDQKEHFGFTDGIAQPAIRGDREPLVAGQDAVAAGEFLLGYPNDYDKLPFTPSVAGSNHARAAGLRACRAAGPHPDSARRLDRGENGSYVVLRKLEQDVEGFWRYFHERAAEIAAPEEVGDVATWLASKCVGRWPSGAPLVKAPHHDDPAAAHPARRDDFRYAEDPDGLRCPFGSHIRRSNPRDSLDRVGRQSISDVSPRRILRRGRLYGGHPSELGERGGRGVANDRPESCPVEERGARGVLFMALCANVRRQFEFVQQTWLGNRRFATLDQDPDPVIGGGRPGDGFTVPAHPYRYRLKDLPRFVTTRGGGYFFMPGLRALAYLAEDPT
jgi:Dyp-type peroxidase family